MEKICCAFTILFEEPFWIGIYEREYDGKYDVCKITFGAEPKDSEVYEFLLKNSKNFIFSPSLKSKAIQKKQINPKRIQRQVKKELENTGVGTKAQQALKLLQEENKTVRKVRTKKQKEEEKLLRFEMHIQKRKEKHRGR